MTPERLYQLLGIVIAALVAVGWAQFQETRQEVAVLRGAVHDLKTAVAVIAERQDQSARLTRAMARKLGVKPTQEDEE